MFPIIAPRRATWPRYRTRKCWPPPCARCRSAPLRDIHLGRADESTPRP